MASNTFPTTLTVFSPFAIQDASSQNTAVFSFVSATTGFALTASGYSGAGVAASLSLTSQGTGGNSYLTFIADDIVLNAHISFAVNLPGSMVFQMSGAQVQLQNSSTGSGLVLQETAASLVCGGGINGSGIYVLPNGNVTIDGTLAFTDNNAPGISASVTTAALIGKTLTFHNGILTGFA